MAEKFLIFFFLLLTASLLFRYVTVPLRRLVVLLLSLLFIASLGLPSLVAVTVLSFLNFKSGSFLKSHVVFYIMLGINLLCLLLFNGMGTVGLRNEQATGYFSRDSLPLLVGLSFYTLQHIAYLIDVHKARIKPARGFYDFLLCSLYFPRFVCGPITLYQDISPQLDFRVEKDLLWKGFNRILLGLFKKLVIAERLAPAVSSVFDFRDDVPGLTILSAAFTFTIQLYFDFSAYADLAIGSSALLGVRLKENFDMPFRSTSVTMFWRRWHQSLLYFFTVYVFYPFVFRFRHLGQLANFAGIAIVFLLSGLWHGLGLTFLLWSLCHIIFLIAEQLLKLDRMIERSVVKIIRSAIVLLALSFSNIFFRSDDSSTCFRLLARLFDPAKFFPDDWLVNFLAPLALGGHQADQFNFILSILFTVGFLLFERKFNQVGDSARLQPAVLFMMLLLIFVFGVFGDTGRFIYMQF